MSLVADSFERVEFRIFVEKIKTNIRNLKFNMSKSMSYQGHKLRFHEVLREKFIRQKRLQKLMKNLMDMKILI